MTYYDYRPMIGMTIAYIAGIIVSNLLNHLFMETAVLLFLLFILMIAGRKHWRRGLIIWICFCLGMTLYQWEIKGLLENKMISYNNENVEVQGRIMDVSHHSLEKSIYKLKVYQINGENKKIKGYLQVSVYNQDDHKTLYDYGDIICIKGKLQTPSGKRNPGGFDYRKYLLRQRIVACLFSGQSNIKKMGEKSSALGKIFLFKQNRERIIRKLLPFEEGALLNGIVFGERSEIPVDILENFKSSGIFHLFAISGFHVGVLLSFFYFITVQAGVRPRARALLTMMIIIFYVIMTGGYPSVLRAGLMGILVLGGIILERDTEIVNSICCAAFFILLFQPQQLFDIGFQLSFVATLGIVLLVSPLQKCFCFLPQWLRIPLSVTLAAQSVTLPLMMIYFHQFSLIGLIANLIVVPMVSLVVYLGFMLVFISIFVPFFILKIFAPYLWLLLKGIIIISDIFASFPYGQIKGLCFSGWEIILYYAFLMAIFDRWQEKPWTDKMGCPPLNKWLLAIIIASISIKSIMLFIPQPLKITVLDVGQGDSIIIETPKHHHILLDGGSGGEEHQGFDTGERIIVPYLYSQHIHTLDAIIVSHPHEDHIGGLSYVLQEIPVGVVMGAAENLKSDLFYEMSGILKEKGVSYKAIGQGNRIQWSSDMYLDVLYPNENSLKIAGDNINNHSLVLKLHYKNITCLLTGDMEREAEEYLLKSHVDLTSDILKVAHHGSDSSSTLKFLQAVKPQFSAISVGENNFGHPSDEVIKRLRSLNCKIFLTQVDGGITFVSDGENIIVKRMISRAYPIPSN